MYNKFFYPSVCHVCKKSGDETALKQCSGCRMIVYCSREHQQNHWPEHKDLCKAIQYLRATFPAELSESQETPKTMKLLKEKVEQNLKRHCKWYEEQMFNYPRMCLVCYKISGELKSCHCMTVWYCPQHKNNHDSDTCERLKLCFELDISLLQELPLSYFTDAYIRVTSYEKDFSNMKEFINIYGDIKRIKSKTPPHLLEIKQSIRLTRLMTVFYGMQILNYMQGKRKIELVLHVIAAHIGEMVTLPEWEILLHIFPTIKCLKLVLIGPLAETKKKRNFFNICDTCKRNKKSLSIEWQRTTYGDYVKKCSTFRQPNLVIAFDSYSLNPNYVRLQYVWVSSLKYIARYNCPFLLSYSYSKENNTLHKIINTVLRSTIEFRNYKNPFASLHPERNYDEHSGYSVYYENAYLNVYKTLCP